MGHLLEVNKLNAYYKIGEEQIHAVSQVDFTLDTGKVLGIAGESGCGKSTLALALMGYTLPPLYIESGDIYLSGENILKLSREEMKRHIVGKHIAYIPQAAMNALNPTLKIKSFVIDVLKTHKPGMSKENMLELAKYRFSSLGLDEKVLEAYPNELSGGMKQRTVIAISTLLDPQILIADEPTSALDVSSQKKVMHLLKKLIHHKFVKAMVFITHELPLLYHIADDVMVMYAGQSVEYGTKDQVLLSPRHPYSKALMGSVLVPEIGAKQKSFVFLEGAPPNLKYPISGCRFYDRCPYRCEQCKQDNMPVISQGDGYYRCVLNTEQEVDT